MRNLCLSSSSGLVLPKKFSRLPLKRELQSGSLGSGLMTLQLRDSNASIRCCYGNVSSAETLVRTPRQDQILLSMNGGGQGNVSGKKDLMPSEEANDIMSDLDRGVGIVRFLKGKKLFITGATGFLAKVLIEKILRAIPDVGKIYVLIKAKNKDAALNRLKCEIINTELFRCLQEVHGKAYQNFMLSKIIPVVGNVRETNNIGIEVGLADQIRKEVDVIINSAANTTFDERYDVALDINTIGPWRLMNFAKRCERLKLLLHVSTAYVNGQRQGRILERPFCIGDTIVNETSSGFSVKSTPLLDIEAEIRLAFASTKKNTSEVSWIQEMKLLGLERANIYGWQNTYVFTKAMGEMILNSMSGHIPVVTIRPSVIESTFKEPFPGWMEGNRMMDPMVLHYGKGQLTGFLADPNGVLDVVPVDMVVNATLAAIAKHGSSGEGGMHIYHVASSMVNPLVFQDLAWFIFQHFTTSPCISSSSSRPVGVEPIKLFQEMDEFFSYISNDAVQRARNLSGEITQEDLPLRLKTMLIKSVEQTKYLATIYEPYTFYKGRFDNTNTQKLMEEMDEEERKNFNFDVRDIDWEEYISSVHVPGLRRHVMKERKSLPEPQLVGAAV